MVYIPLAAYEVPSSEYVILCNPSPASNVTLLLFSSDWYPIQEYKSYAPAFGDTIKTKQLRHSCRAEPDLEIGTLLGRLLFYAVDHPCILAAVSNIQFGSIACTEYSNHYSISVSHYNSFSISRNSFSTHSNIFNDRESELYVSFISKRSNVSVWERVTILYFINL